MALIPLVINAARKLLDYADRALCRSQQKKPRVGGNNPAFKIGDHFFASNAWKLKLQLPIFFHAASGPRFG
jgi:hypothetical protein